MCSVSCEEQRSAFERSAVDRTVRHSHSAFCRHADYASTFLRWLGRAVAGWRPLCSASGSHSAAATAGAGCSGSAALNRRESLFAIGEASAWIRAEAGSIEPIIALDDVVETGLVRPRLRRYEAELGAECSKQPSIERRLRSQRDLLPFEPKAAWRRRRRFETLCAKSCAK